MKYKLYGDGIHDDFPAIQEMIDSGVREVSLPVPEKNYLITKTLELPSNFKLTLPRFAEIKLADGANCLMLKNKTVFDHDGSRTPQAINQLCEALWYHARDFSPAPEHTVVNVEIEGGIWNFNNKKQLENPEINEETRYVYGYSGDGMLFYNVRGIRLSNMTFKDPVHYGATFDRTEYFTIENIVFDYNDGHPYQINTDGVHFNGNCHFGVIKNLKGACYDDLVALNAHEGSKGPITNIVIDGLFAEGCHSAVRMLTVDDDINNIHISNVYGTYYQYCIGITKYYPGQATQAYDAITIDNVCISKYDRYLINRVYKEGDEGYPLIFIQGETRIKNLKIDNVHRVEKVDNHDTIFIGPDCEIDNLILTNITVENHTGMPMALLHNEGTIKKGTIENLVTDGDAPVVGNGKILS